MMEPNKNGKNHFKSIKNKVVIYINNIIYIFLLIISIAAHFIKTICSIIIINMLVFYFFHASFDIIFNYLFGHNVSITSSLYLTLTFTSIVITTIGNNLTKVWHFFTEKEIIARDFQSSIVLSIMNEKRAKYLVYAFYFILLLVFNFCTLSGITLFNTNKLDTAILQSFATFLAFDRLASNKSLLKGSE